MQFMFEKLEVYQRALSIVEEVDKLLDTCKGKLPASRADQLSRASLSVPLNIAEGNGRTKPNDRSQFFVIARGSAFECVPILQVIRRRSLLSEERYQEMYDELVVLAKMLSKLISRESNKQ